LTILANDLLTHPDLKAVKEALKSGVALYL
jgi:hypothetical protein